jgi:hypothetical protein
MAGQLLHNNDAATIIVTYSSDHGEQYLNAGTRLIELQAPSGSLLEHVTCRESIKGPQTDALAKLFPR